MKVLEENYECFEELNVVFVGISVDFVLSKKVWVEYMGLKRLRILSDFWLYGVVLKFYGIFREDGGFLERVNVLVDEEGRVVFFKVYLISEFLDLEEIFEVFY